MRFSLFHTDEQKPSRQSSPGLVVWHQRHTTGVDLSRAAAWPAWMAGSSQKEVLTSEDEARGSCVVTVTGCSTEGAQMKTWLLGTVGFLLLALGRPTMTGAASASVVVMAGAAAAAGGSIDGGGMAEQQKKPVTSPAMEMRFSIRESVG